RSQILDLSSCLRPVRWFTGVPSPVKRPQDTDMVIFRENSEDIYAGIEFEAGTEAAETFRKLLEDNFPKEFGKIRFGSKDKSAAWRSEERRVGKECRARGWAGACNMGWVESG